jgi:hypothetical protein
MRNRPKTILLLLVLFLVCFLSRSVLSQYAVQSSVFGNGFGVITNNSNGIASTVGQPFIGSTSDVLNIHHAGFWMYVNIITGIEGEDDLLPRKFELMQNYPNPFNPTTKIKYAIPQATHVRIEIYNVLGQRVRTLVNEEKVPGYYTVNFDARSLASGFYIYRLQAASGFNSVKKMIVIK